MSVIETSLPEWRNLLIFSVKTEMATILSFEENDSLVVVCFPELFENIPTVCFGFVVLRLLVTRD